MTPRKETLAVISIIFAVYILTIPPTLNIINEYTSHSITVTHSKAHALVGQNVTDVYTTAPKNPITFKPEPPQTTINSTPIDLLQTNKNDTINTETRQLAATCTIISAVISTIILFIYSYLILDTLGCEE